MSWQYAFLHDYIALAITSAHVSIVQSIILNVQFTRQSQNFSYLNQSSKPNILRRGADM